MLKLVLLALMLAKAYVTVEATPQQCENIIKKWAPLVYLAKGEHFKSSSVAFFLNYMKIDGTDGSLKLTPSNLPTGVRGTFLTTRQGLRHATSTNLAFFAGESPSVASAYAILEKKSTTVEIGYWFFYPFNFGKRVCLGIYNKHSICPCFKIFGHCVCPRIPAGCAGIYKTFGNHVADWENIVVVLKYNGSPVKLKYYAHGDAHEYYYKGGNNFVNNKGEKIMFEGTHPKVFSAKGSHGSRASPGHHVYQRLPTGFELDDQCSYGARWETWKNLRMVQKNDFNGQFQFLKYKGRWGNRKRSCGAFDLYEKIADECQLDDGPHGPFS